ncbi:serine/threonine-protein kinase Sgk2, partial [Metarhizium majus ARSEF 297]
MTLTEQQIKIISEHPFNDTLDDFRDKLRDFNESDDPQQEDIANLLGAFVLSTAAFNLPSPDGGGNVAFKLLSIKQHVRGGGIETQQFRPLVRSIVNKSSDTIIWAAVLNLIEKFGPLTPPRLRSDNKADRDYLHASSVIPAIAALSWPSSTLDTRNDPFHVFLIQHSLSYSGHYASDSQIPIPILQPSVGTPLLALAILQPGCVLSFASGSPTRSSSIRDGNILVKTNTLS